MNGDDGTTLVSAKGVSVHHGATAVLTDVDLEINAGQQLALRGRSGSGKTTALLVLAGLLRPTNGTVVWPGLAASPARRRSQIGMVFQAPSLIGELTAAQNVALPLRLSGTGVEQARLGARAALQKVDAADLSDAWPEQLSGGQQQRIAIARALAGNYDLVLADEPTGALDRAHAEEVAIALRDGATASGAALVVATHDPELANLFNDQLTILDGRVRRQVATP